MSEAPSPHRPDPALAARLRAVLRLQAGRGRSLTYQELALAAEVAPPHRIHRVTLALELLIREDHAAGRPLLAALAVSRAGDGVPGRGFFELLRALGRYDGPDRGSAAVACHAAELERALAYWGGDEAPGTEPGT